MDIAVFGIAKNEPQAVKIAEAIMDAGFSPYDLSVLFPDTEGSRDFAHEQHTKRLKALLLGRVRERLSAVRSVG